MAVYKPNNRKIVELYEKAIKEITEKLTEAYSVGSLSSSKKIKDQTTVLLQIYARLNELNDLVEPELNDLIEQKYKHAMANFLVETGQASSLKQAEISLQFGSHSIAKVEMMATDTMQDLLKATDNVKGSIKAIVQEIAAETLQLEYAKNSGQYIMAEKLAENLSAELISERVREQGFTGIIDKAGKKWDIDTYAEMVTRTKLEQVDSEVTRIQGLENGIDLAVISSHGATDACANWEGVVISLNGLTEGFITYSEVKATNECFHPRCQHQLRPLRNLSLVHDRDLQKHHAKIDANRQTVKAMKEKGK